MGNFVFYFKSVSINNFSSLYTLKCFSLNKHGMEERKIMKSLKCRKLFDDWIAFIVIFFHTKIRVEPVQNKYPDGPT